MVWLPDHIWAKQKKGKGKGKGKGSWGGQQMIMVPASMLFGGGWGGGKGGRKGGKGKKKTKFSDLPEEKKDAILAKHAEKASAEGRKPMGGVQSGTIVRALRGYGWIKPANMAKVPKPVKDKMKEMTAEKKANAAEHKEKEDTFDDDILYFRNADVEGYPAIRLKKDMEVKFKVYIDEKGAGAFAVVPPAEANID